MVKEDIIKFIRILNELGLNQELKKLDKDFNQRFLIQKIFYFLEKYGLNLKLKFNFYKYGPYSPYLADLYYKASKISEEKIEELSRYKFNEKEQEILKKGKNLLDKWGIDQKKFEFYSSFLYLYEDIYFKNWSMDKIRLKLSIYKPKLFDSFKFNEVLNDLKSVGLISS